MVSINDSTADELESIAESQEVPLSDVEEAFKEKYEEINERATDVPEDKLERLALRTARTKLQKGNRVPSDEVELLTVGGSVRNWSNGDTFVGKALVDESPNEDGGKPRLSTVIVDEDDVEPTVMMDAFSEVGNVVRGQFAVSQSDVGDFRVLNSTDDTELDVTRPDNRAPLLAEIRDAVPEVTIADIAENLSATTRNDDGDLFPVSFGVDIRRIEGDIYDAYKDPENGYGTYTIRDETVFDEEDIVNSPVHNAEQANENAVPGLTCWTDPTVMEYGSESVCEFYGTVSENDDGEIVMNVDGIVPILEEEWDGYTASSDNDEVDTSNVDRREI